MKGQTVTIKLKPYLVQWLTHAFGSPVRFPQRTYESILLSRLLEKRPAGVTLRPMSDEDCVRIVIPDNSKHRPETYNFLSLAAQRELAFTVENLFVLHLWKECFHLLFIRGSLNSGLNDWCARNGIGIDYRESVRQRFYRMRTIYRRYGVNIGKIYKL